MTTLTCARGIRRRPIAAGQTDGLLWPTHPETGGAVEDRLTPDLPRYDRHAKVGRQDSDLSALDTYVRRLLCNEHVWVARASFERPEDEYLTDADTQTCPHLNAGERVRWNLLVPIQPIQARSGRVVGYSLSQTGNGELQLPDGRHTISGEPISAFPLAQENLTWVFILVLWVLTIKPLLWGISGQWTAENTQMVIVNLSTQKEAYVWQGNTSRPSNTIEFKARFGNHDFSTCSVLLPSHEGFDMNCSRATPSHISRTFHFDLHRMCMSCRSNAGESPRIILRSMINGQPVFQLRVSPGIGRPPFRILPVVMADGPLGVSESTDPEALHVEHGSWVDDQLPVVGLCDRAEFVSEENCGWFLHGVVVLLVEAEARRFQTVPFASHASALRGT